MTGQEKLHPTTAGFEDIPELKMLWKTVFGDPDTDIERFFNVFFTPELTVMINDGSALVSAAYILPVGNLVFPDGNIDSCAMLYAIATHPAFRGRGLGAAVTQAAGTLATDTGYSAVVLRPADEQLFKFYSSRTDFTAFFEVEETIYSREFLPDNTRSCTLSPISPAEYRLLRRCFLHDCIYIDMDERAFTYQQQLSLASGGNLYTVKSGANTVGCAIIEKENHSVYLKELLLSCGTSQEEVISAVALQQPAKHYIVRSPSNTCSSRPETCRPFGMVLPNDGYFSQATMQSAKWYGPAFD